MAKRVAFTQHDLTRAVRACINGGLGVSRTEIAPDGRIVLFHETTAAPAATPYDEWKAARGAR